MKFTDYFILEANKKEKSSIEQDSNIILGTELEFCMKNMSIHNDIADFLKTKTNIDFDYEKDGSVSPDDISKDSSIEIQTKPKPWNIFQEELEELLKLIQKYGYTNDSCGLHVTISYKNIEDLPKDFGHKIHLSMQDPKVYKDFPSRKDSHFAKPRPEDQVDYYHKYYTFRIREKTNHVEFRVIGGKDYEYKWPQIRNLILDYMVNYKKSLLDPEFMKRKSLITKDRRMKNPQFMYVHARDVIKGRWPEVEPIIAKSRFAYSYAKDVIKDRWPEAESTIATDPEHAYFYAKDIIKGRWPEAERFIIKDSLYAYLYAKHVIKGRFPEAEPIIKTNDFLANLYAQDIENEQ